MCLTNSYIHIHIIYIYIYTGGYVAAIKAAQLGLKVACVEARGTLGGTCLNIGCIPSKALLNASHMYHDSKHNFKKYGIDIPNESININVDNMMKYKNKAVTGLTKGIESLFKKNKVDYIKGFASLGSDSTTVHINHIDSDKQSTVSTKNIIIATGSVPSSLPGIDVDEKNIVSSTGALDFTEVPKHLVVIGGGVIGLELGSVWSRLGSKLTVIEYSDRITPGIDEEIAKTFQKILEKQSMKFQFGYKVTNIKQSNNGCQVEIESRDGKTKDIIECDKVLVATGRRPFTKGLNLESQSIKMEPKNPSQIWVDDHFRTSVNNIYAIGDIIRGPMLAHKAEEEGIAAAEIIAGKPGHVNYNAIPGVIYTHPEVATVGASEQDLKNYNIDYKVQKFPMLANSRARTNDDADGLVKILIDKKSDRILGAHIVAPQAGELIAEMVLGIEYGASAEDIARTCHAHPTLSEAVKEACLEKPIHF